MDLRDQGWPEKIGSGLALRQPGMEDIMGSAPGPCRLQGYLSFEMSKTSQLAELPRAEMSTRFCQLTKRQWQPSTEVKLILSVTVFMECSLSTVLDAGILISMVSKVQKNNEVAWQVAAGADQAGPDRN